MISSLPRPVAPLDSDAAVMAASLGDPDAFAGIFERHYRGVHRYLARRLGADLADELAAEVFAIAFAKRRRYDRAHPDARPWLLGIATHLARHHWRREERELRACGWAPALRSTPGERAAC